MLEPVVEALRPEDFFQLAVMSYEGQISLKDLSSVVMDMLRPGFLGFLILLVSATRRD